MDKHKAVVRRGDRCVIDYLNKDEAEAGELIVAPEKVSICGTDMQILRKLRDDPALVVGHEGLAKIVEVGEGVSGFEVGDRVTVNPTHPSDPSFLLGRNINGLLQQRVRIPENSGFWRVGVAHIILYSFSSRNAYRALGCGYLCPGMPPFQDPRFPPHPWRWPDRQFGGGRRASNTWRTDFSRYGA